MPQILGPAAASARRTVDADDPVGAPKGVADPADAGKIELPLEIAAAGQYLWRHRIQHRPEPDMVARIELVARLRNMQTQAVRLIGGVKSG
jgi:hypothetical protein